MDFFYNALYTFFVISPMMGKSRFMKEMAKHMSFVYICTRNSSRYPGATPHVVAWFDRGSTSIFDPRFDKYTMAVQDKAFLLRTKRLELLTHFNRSSLVANARRGLCSDIQSPSTHARRSSIVDVSIFCRTFRSHRFQ